MSAFNFEISSAVKHALQDMGFEKPTEIQEKAIPLILEGKDVIGKSQTGSGKTVAFGIPAIEAINPDMNKKYTQVLVLCPTRELAIQATGEIRKLTKYTHGIKTLAVYGGQPIGRQIPLLRQGAQIVVGTPGRVMDHIRRKTLKLTNLQMVVLDEADEMLNMGFREDIETILKEVPQERQTVLFSATMPKAIMDIVNNYQQEPVTVEVAAKQMTVDTIEQYYIDCPKGRKADILYALLDQYNIGVSIVFCNTKKMVDELTENLEARGIAAKGLHGDMRQRERDAVMMAFRKGKATMLVATDVAARGIDVDNVEAVFNFDIPTQTEYYVHRIGRTGRAGKKGLSFTLAQGRRQVVMMKDLMRFTKTEIRPLQAPQFKGEVQLGKFVQGEETPAPRFQKDRFDKNYGDRDNKRPRNRDKGDYSDKANTKQKRYTYEDGQEKQSRPRFERNKEDKRTSSEEMYSMRLSIGRTSGATPRNLMGAIAGESGIRGSEIGDIAIKDSYSLVEIPLKHKDKVLQAVEGARIGGKRVNVK